MPDRQISVAIVDDHPVVLQGLETMIDAEPDMVVVATARDGDEAVRRIVAARPDVVIMDIRMPECDGVEAAKRILEGHPDTRIILLSGEEGPSVVDGLKAGAYGFLSKTSIGQGLIDGIRDAASGKPVVASSLLNEVLAALREISEENPLSELEQAILHSVADGKTNEQIAHELDVSVSTVKGHLAAVYEKVGARDRASALAVCFRQGWLE